MAASYCGLLFGSHSTEEQCYRRNIIDTGCLLIQAPFIATPGRLIRRSLENPPAKRQTIIYNKSKVR